MKYPTNKVCLVIIFNHRYEKNLPKLRKLYSDNFPDIFYLMPFYRGDDQDVIPVYEHPHYYQGYIRQAFSRLFLNKYEAFIFMADDLILNPAMTADNIHERLDVDMTSAYIKSLRPLSDAYFLWIYVNKTLRAFDKAFDYDKELPAISEATRLFANHDLHVKDLGLRNLRGWFDKTMSFRGYLPYLHHTEFWKQLRYPLGIKQIPYPMLFGYSDFFIVPSAAFKEFARLCGVFAAMNLWVECAIPTAMALSSLRIVTEQKGAQSWRGKELWGGQSEVEEYERANNYDLTTLLRSFEPNQLYLHPVKLSKWK